MDKNIFHKGHLYFMKDNIRLIAYKEQIYVKNEINLEETNNTLTRGRHDLLSLIFSIMQNHFTVIIGSLELNIAFSSQQKRAM